jgi:hypothetical protein
LGKPLIVKIAGLQNDALFGLLVFVVSHGGVLHCPEPIRTTPPVAIRCGATLTVTVPELVLLIRPNANGFDGVILRAVETI